MDFDNYDDDLTRTVESAKEAAANTDPPLVVADSPYGKWSGKSPSDCGSIFTIQAVGVEPTTRPTPAQALGSHAEQAQNWRGQHNSLVAFARSSATKLASYIYLL